MLQDPLLKKEVAVEKAKIREMKAKIEERERGKDEIRKRVLEGDKKDIVGELHQQMKSKRGHVDVEKELTQLDKKEGKRSRSRS